MSRFHKAASLLRPHLHHFPHHAFAPVRANTRITRLNRLRSLSTTPITEKDESGRSNAAETDPTAEFKLPPQSKLQPAHPTHRISPRAARHKPALPTFSLQGKVAVITGGAGGLGVVMAQGLLMSGANVALADVDESSAKTATSRLLANLDPDGSYNTAQSSSYDQHRVTTHTCDVSSPASVEECIASILATHSQIDTLITAAGFTENFPAESYPVDRMRKLWAVNVDGTYLVAAAVARHMIERAKLALVSDRSAASAVDYYSGSVSSAANPGEDQEVPRSTGSMVFVGSMSGSIVNLPQPQAPYNASKAAVRQLAASFAVEWAKYGIRVNCLSPGYMLTPLTETILTNRPDFRETWTSLTPMGRLGRPEDLMGAVCYLASDASGYVTGIDLKVDGGYTVI